jgi:hypothetical protein
MRSKTRPAAASRKWKLGSEKHSTLGRQNPRENQHWLATDEVRNQARLRPAKENQKRLLRSSAKKKSFCAATCLSRKRRRHARWRKSHGRKPDGSRNLETQKKGQRANPAHRTEWGKISGAGDFLPRQKPECGSS